LAILGCRQNQMNFDPFAASGPSLMPPPSTGSAGRPDPYYRPASPAAAQGALNGNGPAALPAHLARFTSDHESATTELADRRAAATP
jgi:hypothetical protein